MTKCPRWAVRARYREISSSTNCPYSCAWKLAQKYGHYDGRPADNCTRGDVRSWKERLTLYGTLTARVREKCGKRAATEFHRDLHLWSSSWAGCRCAGGVLKLPWTWGDSIDRGPYRVSTAWAKGRVSDANCKLRS